MTRVAVVGQGKLGFPVAAYLAHRGAEVVGIDVDPSVVGTINRGESPVPTEPGATDHVADLVATGALRATSDYAEGVGDAEAVLVLVPLLARDGAPDFSMLDAAVAEIARHLAPRALVVFETTLPLGTTRQRFAPVLRSVSSEVRVAYSPERVSSNRVWRDLDTYPKLVGGVDGPSAEAAAAFYRRYLAADVRLLSSAETAELAKLAETTYRDLNIAFANELAKFADEWSIDVGEVIDAANSQPYSHIHRPGVGVGGHCIPHYPYLLQASTQGSSLIATAREINEHMPEWVIQRIEKEVGPLAGTTVHLLGVSYRGGVKEAASSPVHALVASLLARDAAVTVSDPFYSAEELRRLGLPPGPADGAEVIVLVTDHQRYRSIDWRRHAPALIVDGRGALDRREVEAAGCRYLGVGR